MNDTIQTGRYAGMTWCAWTDYTLFRLGEKLDADRKNPGLLESWMKGAIFSIFSEAKRAGPSYRLNRKGMQQAEAILKTRVADIHLDQEALVE